MKSDCKMPSCPHCKVPFALGIYVNLGGGAHLEPGNWILCDFCAGVAMVLEHGIVGVLDDMVPQELRPFIEAAQRITIERNSRGSVH